MFSFLWPKRPNHIPLTTDLSGKTVLVTGANIGLGFEVALQFLQLHPARVIITARTPAKCEDTVKRLSEHPDIVGLPVIPEIISAVLALEDYGSVTSFVKTFDGLADRLDVVVHNAGMNGSPWYTSKNNHEIILQVNYLAPAYLTLALLPILRRTAALSGEPSRFTWVSSFIQSMNSLSNIPLDKLEPGGLIKYLDDKQKHGWLWRYQDSKALASWFIAELASRVNANEVILNSVCPGVVRDTEIDRTNVWYLWICSYLLKLFAGIDVDEGARRYVHASVVVGSETHGRFLSNYLDTPLVALRPAKNTRIMRSRAWDETIAETQGVDPAVTI